MGLKRMFKNQGCSGADIDNRGDQLFVLQDNVSAVTHRQLVSLAKRKLH